MKKIPQFNAKQASDMALKNQITKEEFINNCQAMLNDKIIEAINQGQKRAVLRCKYLTEEDVNLIAEPFIRAGYIITFRIMNAYSIIVEF